MKRKERKRRRRKKAKKENEQAKKQDRRKEEKKEVRGRKPYKEFFLIFTSPGYRLYVKDSTTAKTKCLGKIP